MTPLARIKRSITPPDIKRAGRFDGLLPFAATRRRQNSRRWPAWAALLLTAALCPFDLSRTSGAERPPLVFLGDQDYPPVAYLDEGIAKGMDVDLAKALAAPMQREIRIQLTDWNLAQEKILQGAADGLLGLSISAERRRLYDFASPTFTREFGIVVRTGEKTIRGARDLKGKSVGVTPGGFPRRFLEGRPGVHLIFINNYKDGLDRLAAGTINAMAADLWVAAYLIERGGIRGVTIVGKPFATAQEAIAVKKGNLALVNEIDRAINTLKADGTISRIQDDWLPQEMLFASRARVRTVVTMAIGAFLVILFAAMGVWIITLKKQMGIRRKAESALKQSEERFQLAVCGSTDGLWDRNILTNEVFFADRYRELLGYAADEFPGAFASFETHLHPDDRDRVLKSLASHLDERTPYDAEYRLRTKSGQYRWFRGRGQAIWDEQGRAIRMAGSITDITERKQAEQAVRESEERYRVVVESSPECVAVSVDERLVYVNPAGARIVGAHHSAELIGRDVYDFVPVALHEAMQERRHQILQQGISAPPVEFSVLRLDGLAIQVESQAVPFSYGGKAAILTLMRDISARKQAEEALRHSEELFRGVVEDQTEMIVRWKPDGTRTFVNEAYCRVFGGKPDDFVGSSFFPLVTKQDRERIRQKIRSLTPTNPVAMDVHQSLGPVGEIGWQEWTDRGIFDPEGRLVELQSTGRDITERKRVEMERGEVLLREQRAREEYTQQLIASQEAERRRLAAELHDGLGQNLVLIKNRALLGLESRKDAAGLTRHLESISDATSLAIEEARSLAQNLHPYQLEQLGLTEAIRVLLDKTAAATTVRFEVELEDVDDLFSLEAATNLYRLVQEGTNNLVKHSGATIARVAVQRDVHCVRVRIQDDGRGFDPALSAPRPGGLGLTSMRERTRMLSGTLEIISRPGAGTELRVEIPLSGKKQNERNAVS